MLIFQKRRPHQMGRVSQVFGLIMLLVVAGCDSNGPGEVSSDPGDDGGVAFTFTRGAHKTTNGFPEPTNVRVIVRRFESEELAFNALADVQVPTDTTVVVSVPANEGYRIDAFSYIDTTAHRKPLLKFDQVEGVVVSPDEVTNVSLVLEPATVTVSVPDTVEQGEKFSVSATIDGLFNLADNSTYEPQYLATVKVDSFYVNSISNNTAWDYTYWYASGNAPIDWQGVSVSEFGDTHAYFQVTALLEADELYKDGEGFRSFVFNYPSPYIEDTVRTFVKVPAGGIGVDVVY